MIPGALAAPIVVELWAQLLVVGTGQQCEAGGDVGDDSCSVIGGVDYARSFGSVGYHAADFSAGAEADYAVNGGVSVTEWIVPSSRKMDGWIYSTKIPPSIHLIFNLG